MTCVPASVALPELSRDNVTFWQRATGPWLSVTVTVALQLAALPKTSVAVKTTVFAPILPQVNVEGLTVAVKVVQASAVPNPTTDAPRLPFPLASKVTVAFVQMTTGAETSETVTVPAQVETFPARSVKVNVTILAPRLEQVKVFGATTAVNPPQLSLEPNPTTEAPRFPFPLASKVTVALVQIAFGGVASLTWMLAVQVLLKLPSLTVKTTLVLPKANGPAGATLKVNGSLFGSELPLLKSAATALPWQLASAVTVIFWQTAFGAWLQLVPSTSTSG